MSLFFLILYIILQIYFVLIFVDIIFSWIPNIFQFRICRFIHYLVGWFMEPFHGIITISILDFTPIIGIFIYQGILDAVFALLSSIG